MYSKLTEFSNLDLYSCQDLDNLSNISPDLSKPLLITSIPQSLGESLEESFYQRLTPTMTTGCQISFQKNFMREHKVVFTRELQNYMESLRIYQNNTGFVLPQTTLLAPQLQDKYFNCELFIKNHRLGLSDKATEDFVEALNSYDKLSQFLDIVVAGCHSSVAVELINIAHQMLEKYQSVKLNEPSERELLTIASDLAKSPKAVKLIILNNVNLKCGKESVELLEKSKRFMEVYCATVMLVIGQYFGNNYFQEESELKRPLSPWSLQDDDEIEMYSFAGPSKKRKFSF